jgi:hypothetical protein
MSLAVLEIAAEIEAGQWTHPLARSRLLIGWTPQICRNRFTNRFRVSSPGKMSTGRVGKARQDAQHDEANHGKPDQRGGGKSLRLILARLTSRYWARGTHRILASADCGLPVGPYLR